MINRRNFLKTTGAFATGSVLVPSLLSSSYKNKTIGLQLYSVRDKIKNGLNPTLNKIAEMGYNSLEAAGYDINERTFYGMSPNSFASLTNSLGMTLNSTHTIFEPDIAEQVCEDAAKAGLKYIVYPSLKEHLRKNLDDYKSTAERFNKMGEIANRYELKLGYHNHAFEFEKMEGKIPYEVLLEETDPSLVTFEMDLYWVFRGGYDPVKYFKKYPGRFELWHVKDMADSEDQFFSPVGQGVIDFKRIFAKKEEAGMKLFFVEQDRFIDLDPFESINISYNYLNNSKFI